MSKPLRSLFDIPHDIAYFNSANIGPRLHDVSDSGRKAIDRYSRPWDIKEKDWFDGPEKLRTAFGKFIGVKPDQIALIPSVSYGIALSAKNLPLKPGNNIVVIEEQYPSNFYTWHRKAKESSALIKTAHRGQQSTLTESVIQNINRDTAIVSIPNCHWTDGEVIDLESISDACRKVGAKLVVDASQSLGVRPIDFSYIKPDFVVSVGYKWLLGPYGLGYLYVDEEWCTKGIPLEESWLTRKGSEIFSNLVKYTDEYRPGARRFDFGEFPQFISVPMAIAAITQLNKWGIDAIESNISQHIETIRNTCENAGFQLLPLQCSSKHMIGVSLPEAEKAADLNSILNGNNVIVSQRGQIIRIAPHMHTTVTDVKKLCDIIQSYDF